MSDFTLEIYAERETSAQPGVSNDPDRAQSPQASLAWQLNQCVYAHRTTSRNPVSRALKKGWEF